MTVLPREPLLDAKKNLQHLALLRGAQPRRERRAPVAIPSLRRDSTR
jgi:hypothetical protein